MPWWRDVTNYEFKIILQEGIELTESVANALFEAGCDDCSPGMCNGLVLIDFHREASTLEEAILSATTQVRTAGFEVTRVELEPLAVVA